MPFTFFHPWFLLGALAIAAPIWLHLRRRTETNLIRFPTLRFLDDAPQARTSPLRLQDILLFLLRAMALALLVAAFAWPYLREKEQAIVRESRIYILDNTLSHQADNGFERDRNRIADELGRAGSDVQAAVIELSGQPRVLAGFAESREEARQRVKALAPSFQRGSYLAAFRLAQNLAASSLGERKRIVLFGDSQENQWTESVSTPPFLRDVTVETPRPASSNAPNLAVSEPRLQRIFLGEKSLVNFTVKLVHDGRSEAARVVLTANGQQVFDRALALTNHAESILLQAQWESNPAEWVQGSVAVEGAPDALPGDNRAFFSLAPVREGKVALLAVSPYLRLALSPEVMQGHWETRILDPVRLSAELASGKHADVLVIESGYLQSSDARNLVQRYLSNGRGVLLAINRVTPGVAGALRDLGFEASAVSAVDGPRREALRYVFSGHAIFHPFLSPDYGNLLEVTVSGHAKVKAMQAVPLVFSESGEALFFQGTRFPGRLFVSAFGFEREQTSWPTHVTFVPFLDLCLQNARPEDPTPLDYEPGAVAVLGFPPDSAVREVVLREGPTELQRAAVVQGKAQLRLPDRPGLFAVAYDNAAAAEKVFSVNASPKESRLAYLAEPEALKLWQVDAGERKPKPALTRSPGEVSLGNILRQQFWWWLLLGAAGALFLEMVWTGLKPRAL